MTWTKIPPTKPGFYWIAINTETRKKLPPKLFVCRAVLHERNQPNSLPRFLLEYNFHERPLACAMYWWEGPLSNDEPAPPVIEVAVADKKELEKRKFPVVVQKWEESERGWGTRPDGWTMHLTEADRAAFVDWYYKEHHTSASAPDEYTRTDGAPFIIDVDQTTYDNLAVAKKNNNLGVWGEGILSKITP